MTDILPELLHFLQQLKTHQVLFTIFGISSVVAIMSSIISSYLQETTKDELFTSNWRDSLEP
jgi:hypothetical protein